MTRIRKRLLTKPLAFALAIIGTTASLANPVLNNVTAGNATVTQSANTTTVNQTSGRAILDWRSFNIQNNETTQFNQPAGGIALNRIDPTSGVSTIQGKLSATGQIILINGAGFNFGPNAVVNVGGLVVSTTNMTNDNFMAGKYIFDIPGNPNAHILNQGTIKAADYGLVALIGPYVHNQGLIQAQLGTVIIGSGNKFTVNFSGNQLINFSIDEAANHAKIMNMGSIIANGGQIIINAKTAQTILDNTINMNGVVQANTVATKNGEIILMSNGDMHLHGKILAQGNDSGQRGGNIKIFANNIDINKQVTINADGRSQGGNIVLAGYNSTATNFTHALNIGIDNDAILSASAFPQVLNNNSTGIGGSISLYADNVSIGGKLLATGITGGGSVVVMGNQIALQSTHGHDSNSLNNNGGGGDDHNKTGALIDTSTYFSGNGGDILLSASNTLSINGMLKAIGKMNNANGGTIKLLSNNIAINSDSMALADGISGAGSILVAGYGSDATFTHAQQININANTILSASVLPNNINATNMGTGGTITIAGDNTTIAGKILASGLTRGGSILVDGSKIVIAPGASGHDSVLKTNGHGDDDGHNIPDTSYPLLDASVTGSAGQAGTITVNGDNLQINGILTAVGLKTNQSGGTINLTGNTINIASSLIATTSYNGGGTINMGPATHNATNSSLTSQTSIIDASALGANGGAGAISMNASTVNINNQVSASANGDNGFGGLINISGKNITLAEKANIDVSGQAGGGKIVVGTDPFVNNVSEADNITIANGSVINAMGKNTLASSGGAVFIFGVNTDFNGKILASGLGNSADSFGGRVEVLANNHLHLGSTSSIDASSNSAGGMVLVGGALHGDGIEANAADTTVDAGSNIDVSSNLNGNAGNVVIWSENATTFNGAIKAHGGPQGGDGGMVQISGHGTVANNGTVDVSAPNGNPGTVITTP